MFSFYWNIKVFIWGTCFSFFRGGFSLSIVSWGQEVKGNLLLYPFTNLQALLTLKLASAITISVCSTNASIVSMQSSCSLSSSGWTNFSTAPATTKVNDNRQQKACWRWHNIRYLMVGANTPYWKAEDCHKHIQVKIQDLP